MLFESVKIFTYGDLLGAGVLDPPRRINASYSAASISAVEGDMIVASQALNRLMPRKSGS